MGEKSSYKKKAVEGFINGGGKVRRLTISKRRAWLLLKRDQVDRYVQIRFWVLWHGWFVVTVISVWKLHGFVAEIGGVVGRGKVGR